MQPNDNGTKGCSVTVVHERAMKQKAPSPSAVALDVFK